MLEIHECLVFLDLLLGVSALVLFQRLFVALRSKERGKSFELPPGPRPLPLIGNLFDIPKPGECEWLHWAAHKHLYGPISSVTVFGQTIVILNDRQMAIDLFEKRSTIYSDRPVLTFGGEMCGWNDIVGMQNYGPVLQTMRRHIHQFMGTQKALERFHGDLILEVRRFLLQAHQTPKALHGHIRSLAGAIILNITYGYKVNQNADDPLVALAEKAMQQLSETFIPGAWLVDTVPALRYMPDWFPGTSFKRVAKEYKRTFTEFKDTPHLFVKQQMREGSALPSFTADLLEQGSEDPDYGHETMIKHIAVTLFAGGADTTSAAIYSFFLAMTLYPSVQRRAQEEILAVIGSRRLPVFEDSPKLPYIDAIVKETHRWNPVAPMGSPHTTLNDDVYGGFFIPKGAPVVANIWHFTHDPAVYLEPMVFKPERFLTGPDSPRDHMPERDPREVIFGFGRRICPGRKLADTSLFITISMFLAVFDIKPPRDASGQELKPRYEYSTGFLSHPKDFECILIPRSDIATALINSVAEEHPLDLGDAEKLLRLDQE